MKTVYKYEISLHDITTILTIPANSQPLSVMEQKGVPFIYMLVDTDQLVDQTDMFFVYCFGTGQNIPDSVSGKANFIGTITLWDMPYAVPYVLHVFA
jgi:hypothetical protein